MTIGWVAQQKGGKFKLSKYADFGGESEVRASSLNIYVGSLSFYRQLCWSNILQII